MGHRTKRTIICQTQLIVVLIRVMVVAKIVVGVVIGGRTICEGSRYVCGGFSRLGLLWLGYWLRNDWVY